MQKRGKNKHLVVLTVLVLLVIISGFCLFFNFRLTGNAIILGGTPICGPNTYYIDFNNGDDTNNGTCTTSPWKHSPGDSNALGNVVTAVLHSGDSILFKGGVQYIGTINLQWSGSNGNPIIYDGNSLGNFGTGKAIIGGNNSMTYGFYAPNGKNYLTFNNFEFYKIGGLPSYTGYNCSTNPLPDKLGYGFYLVDSTHITIKNSYFHELGYWQNTQPVSLLPGSAGFGGYGIYVFGIDNLTISNNEFSRLEKGIRISPGQYGSLKSATQVMINNNNFHNYIRWMIELSTSASNTVLQDISVYGNNLHDFPEYTVENWQGCGPNDHTDGIIMGVSDYTNRVFGSPSHPIRVYANNFYENANTGDGGTAMIFLTAMGGTIYVYNNVFVNVRHHGEGAIYVQDGVTVASGDSAVDYHFYGNTFYDSNYGIFLRTVSGASYALNRGNISIKNNIFYHSGNDSSFSVTIYDNYSNPRVLDYNLYYTDRSDQLVINWKDNGYNDVSGARTSWGYEIYGKQANPLFLDISYGLGLNSNLNDLRLLSNSPGVDAGADLSDYFTTDKEGISRPQGSASDMGAYEYYNATTMLVNGVCGTLINGCISGNWKDDADNSTNYLWKCIGRNGGTNASCTLAISSALGNSSNSSIGNSTINTTMNATNNTMNVTLQQNNSQSSNNDNYVPSQQDNGQNEMNKDDYAENSELTNETGWVNGFSNYSRNVVIFSIALIVLIVAIISIAIVMIKKWEKSDDPSENLLRDVS